MSAAHREPPPAPSAAGRQIRGSLLLLSGRLIALAMNFAVQVLIVRSLSKSDFGAFSYALMVVTTGSTVALMGLDKTATVFVPTYHERRDHRRLLGTIATVLTVTLSLALVVVVLVAVLGPSLGRRLGVDDRALRLTLIMIALVPVQVLDNLVASAFAVLGNPRAIFARGYVLAPLLRLAVVLLFAVQGRDVAFLAAGYVGAAVTSLLVCTVALSRSVSGAALLRRWRREGVHLPLGTLARFTGPLLASDLRFLLGPAAAVLLLEHHRDPIEVATFRAIAPVAALNELVFQSFRHLYMPLAARAVARHDDDGLRDLYCRGAAWIAVISFPIFVVTFGLGRPLISLLYGARYQQSDVVLALLSLSFYCASALGFNDATLRVVGKTRYSMGVDVLGAVAGIAASALLIPRYGALGAAISVGGTLLVINTLYQFGLERHVRIKLSEWRWLRIYLVLAAGMAGAACAYALAAVHVAVSLALAGAIALVVLKVTLPWLDVEHTFPELLRFGLVRQLVSSNAVAVASSPPT